MESHDHKQCNHDHDHKHNHDHNHDHANHKGHSHKNHSHKDHDHHHHGFGGHSHAHGAPVKVLLIAVILTLGFAIIEAFGGWWTKSLVLMSDAGHMTSDALALGISAFAAWIAIRPPSEQHSYGLGRAEVIGAWISSLLMVVVVVTIIFEAIRRFKEPEIISGGWVMIIASTGLLINLGLAWMLSRTEKTLNVRAAIIHVIGDLLGSVAALVSGAVIYFTHWTLIDPILSIFICLLILFSSVQLLRESLLVLMEGVPSHLDLNTIGKSMAQIANVRSIHDLHIWTLSSGVIVLSAHVEIDQVNQWDSVLQDLSELLKHEYNISHITLQPETHAKPLLPLHG